MTKKSNRNFDLFMNIVLILLSVLWLYPYIWLALSSFKPSNEIFTGFFPSRLTLDHYRFIFETAQSMERPFFKALLNSIFVSGTVTASVILTSCIISFALTKYEYKGGPFVINFIIFQMLLPGFMFTIPTYILIRNMGLLNSYSALILPSIMSGWGIFMISQSYKATPTDYIEAARIDGAKDIWIIFKIMMPLNKSAISIVGLFTFIGIWDNFMWPLIVMKDYQKMPLSVLLASFNHEYGAYVGPVLAGAVMQTIPMVIIFILFRKYFLQGISMSLK